MNDLNLSGGVTVTVDGLEPPPASPPDPDADAEKDAKEGRISAATTLATGVTVLAAALGLFGGLTGAVARMARNYPSWSTIAILLVVASVALAIAARLAAPGNGQRKALILLAEHRKPYWSTALLWISSVCFAGGIGLAVVLLALTIDKDDRPSVTAVTTRDATTGVVALAGTAKASGLAAEDAIRVVAVAFPKGETEQGTQVYYAVVGPNADGVIDHSFTVILPEGARSVVITAGNDAKDTSGAPKACKPSSSVDRPVDPTDPVKVSSEDGSLTACALVAVPKEPKPKPSESPAGDTKKSRS